MGPESNWYGIVIFVGLIVLGLSVDRPKPSLTNEAHPDPIGVMLRSSRQPLVRDIDKPLW